MSFFRYNSTQFIKIIKVNFVTHHTAFTDIEQSVIVPDSLAGLRLDQVLSELFGDYSRSQLQKWLKAGDIVIDGQIKKAKDKLIGGEKIHLKTQLINQTQWQPEAMDLNIIYEDGDIIVINKPAGLVVHPGAGNPTGTLSNALLAHDPAFQLVPRAGIVHRLDKDTSGLMVAAKSLAAHTALVESLSKRQVKREYEAIASGFLNKAGSIRTKMGRNPHHRLKMAVTPNGKDAITHVKIIEHYRAHTRIRCCLETGRTHQIRVHLQHIGAPLVGDPLYNPRLKLPKGSSEALVQALRDFKRQALHAWRLGFIHPISGETLVFKAPLPNDLKQLMRVLREDGKTLYHYEEDEFDFDDEFNDAFTGDFDDDQDDDDIE
ncbi:MAG: 23S rRNA pseudouridine(1911/1915/1917) synthase RluD [Francisellaceae bacterium]